jgi:hypothetical protein
MKQLGGLGAMDPQETKLPTFEEFANKRAEELGFTNWTTCIVNQEWGILEQIPLEFAKLHVEAALEAQQSYFNKYTQLDEGYENAYPLENIK